MPPKPSNHAQYPVSDPDNEVVCPITQQDGTGCRKRCLGEKRFRSMQEHIRRAHPEYYIPKLPATKESFDLMVNSPPHEVPQPVQHYAQQQQDQWSPPSERREHHYLSQNGPSDSAGIGIGQIQVDAYYGNAMSPYDRPAASEFRRGSLLPAASAAAALAQLHYARPDGEWAGDHVGLNEQQFLDSQYQTDGMGNGNGNGHHTSNLLPSAVDEDLSPPHRSSAPAVQKTISRNRQRKSSVSQNGRRPRHERKTSKDYLRPTGHDRRGTSMEPSASALSGRRWEDLIDAATSATEEDSRDLTPIPASPFQSPQAQNRTPMAPFALGAQFQSYTASPLQNALTPPPADSSTNLDLQSFPSVDEPSSIESTESGTNFQIMPSNQATMSSASDSSPMFNTPVQIYCAGCRRLSILKESFACTECICGLCTNCVDALMLESARGRMMQCPHCQTMGGRFKPFELDIR